MAGLEQGDAISTAARAGILAAFTAGRGYSADAEDAMRRLVASGLLPERAGQPVKVWAHVSLAELRALDDGSVLAGPRSPPLLPRLPSGPGTGPPAGGGGPWPRGQALLAPGWWRGALARKRRPGPRWKVSGGSKGTCCASLASVETISPSGFGLIIVVYQIDGRPP
jgi:hypothetical protein